MTYNTLGERFVLGIEVTIIGMLIVFAVLALLCGIISVLSNFVKKFEKSVAKSEKQEILLDIDETEEYRPVEKTGFTSGEVNVFDAEDEEIAAILASVAFDSDISLSELKVKSIKKIN